MIQKYLNLPVVVRAGLWFTISNFLQKGINFVTVPIFTRIMSTDEFGIFSVYTSWHSILTIFATLNLSYYVFNKGLVKYEDDRNQFVVSIQSLSATITMGFFVVYGICSSSLEEIIGLPVTMMLCMMVQILFEPPVYYWTAWKRFEYEYKSVIAITMIMSIANPLLGIILIKLNAFSHTSFDRSFSVAVITAVFGLVFAIVIIKKGRCAFSTKYWKYALAFNVPLIPHYLSTTVLSQADRIMISHMCGNTEAALYSVAYAIGMVCTLFSQAILQAYLPWLYKKMKKEDYSDITRITNCFLVGIILILLILICFSPEIIWIVGSSEYKPAVWAIPPICGSIFFIFLQNLFANIEYYYEKTKMIAAASVGVAVLNIALNYFFIDIYGFIAAAYTTLFCYLAYAIVHFFVMRSICIKNDLAISKLFDMKVIIILSFFILVVLFFMTLIYSNYIFRYLVVLVIIVASIIFRKRIINIIHTVKEKAGE